MNKEEQIKEIQQDIMDIGYEYGYDTNEFVGLGEKLYNAGYRKVFPGTTEEDVDLTEDDAVRKKVCEDCQNQTREKVIKEFKELAEKLKRSITKVIEDNEDNDGRIATGILFTHIMGVTTPYDGVLVESIIDQEIFNSCGRILRNEIKLLKEYEDERI